MRLLCSESITYLLIRWLMVFNLTLFIILELASGFCNSLGPFLAVRALYGVCMGVRYDDPPSTSQLTPPGPAWTGRFDCTRGLAIRCSRDRQRFVPARLCRRISSGRRLLPSIGSHNTTWMAQLVLVRCWSSNSLDRMENLPPRDQPFSSHQGRARDQTQARSSR